MSDSPCPTVLWRSLVPSAILQQRLFAYEPCRRPAVTRGSCQWSLARSKQTARRGMDTLSTKYRYNSVLFSVWRSQQQRSVLYFAQDFRFTVAIWTTWMFEFFYSQYSSYILSFRQDKTYMFCLKMKFQQTFGCFWCILQVLVKDSRSTESCRSILDPHVRTFDGVWVESA